MKIIKKIIYRFADWHEKERIRNENLPWYMQGGRGPTGGGLAIASAFLLVGFTYLGVQQLAYYTSPPKKISMSLTNPQENVDSIENLDMKSYQLLDEKSEYRGILFRCNLKTGEAQAKTLRNEIYFSWSNCNQQLNEIKDQKNNKISSYPLTLYISKGKVTAHWLNFR